MRLSLEQIQGMLGATLHCTQDAQHTEILSVCRDTNDATKQSLFVCIEGQRFDGHDFAAKAVENGAVALIVSRILPDIKVPQFLVNNTVKALGKLANAWRKQFTGKLIAITGSAGKTTLKECLAQILEGANKSVSCSILNYNNQIGLPLSILATQGTEDYWVMEAGISQPQDMDELGEILEPDFALVLNAGVGHTEGLGLKGVAYHKAQLLKYIKYEGSGAQAFVCADYAELVKESQSISKNICYFSANAQSEFAYLANFTATYSGIVQQEREFKGRYNIKQPNDSVEILTPFCGSYGAENVAAIMAIVHALGLSNVVQSMADLKLPKQRFHTHRIGNWCVIDDSYNANVLSMARMLEASVQQAGTGPCYAVLGAMGELGTLASLEHENLGRNLGGLGISNIFWKGPYAEEVQRGLELANYKGSFVIVQDSEDFAAHWKAAQLASGTVLIKGSRSNALENLVNVVLEEIKMRDIDAI